MKKIILAFVFIALTTQSCGIYSFTGGDTGDAETIQIDYFPNNAMLVEPSVSQKFTDALRDLFTRQTNLSLTTNNGDLYFEGEVTDYRVIPITATADQKAAQNRLTITVRVRYYNKIEEDKDFEKTFSFYSDFGANQQLTSVLDGALDEIFERITQDIFNASVGNW